MTQYWPKLDQNIGWYTVEIRWILLTKKWPKVDQEFVGIETNFYHCIRHQKEENKTFQRVDKIPAKMSVRVDKWEVY